MHYHFSTSTYRRSGVSFDILNTNLFPALHTNYYYNSLSLILRPQNPPLKIHSLFLIYSKQILFLIFFGTLQFFEMQAEASQLTSGITNERVKQLILSHKNLGRLINAKEEGKRHAQEVHDHQHYLKQYEERRWLIKKGKKYLIDFDNQERREMKQYFNSLDEKKSGSIGIDQLEELLFSVGLFETRQEIKALIDSVDEDKSGKIEFGEFLSMIQNDQGQNDEIVQFFKTVIGGKMRKQRPYLKITANKKVQGQQQVQHSTTATELQQRSINQGGFFIQSKYKQQAYRSKSHIPEILEKYPYPKGLPFQMVVSHIRRKHMMTALNIGRVHRKQDDTEQPTFTSADNTIQQIAKGQRVMFALQKMYERKLIRQIKENKRASDAIPPSIAKTVQEKFRISFTHRNNRNNNTCKFS